MYKQDFWFYKRLDFLLNLRNIQHEKRDVLKCANDEQHPAFGFNVSLLVLVRQYCAFHSYQALICLSHYIFNEEKNNFGKHIDSI